MQLIVQITLLVLWYTVAPGVPAWVAFGVGLAGALFLFVFGLIRSRPE